MRITSDTIDISMYILQERTADDDGWQIREFSPTMYGEDPGWPRRSGSIAPCAREFSACGDCWQKTGVYGSFNYDLAVLAFSKLVKNNPNKQFRLAMRTYKIQTQAVMTSG